MSKKQRLTFGEKANILVIRPIGLIQEWKEELIHAINRKTSF